MARAHGGIREYGGEEYGNVLLGQLGFKALSSAGNTGDGNFVAFKVLGGLVDAKVDIECTSHQGDDLSIDNVLTGEIVWGPFKVVRITNVGTDVQVLCYYGRAL